MNWPTALRHSHVVFLFSIGHPHVRARIPYVVDGKTFLDSNGVLLLCPQGIYLYLGGFHMHTCGKTVFSFVVQNNKLY